MPKTISSALAQHLAQFREHGLAQAAIGARQHAPGGKVRLSLPEPGSQLQESDGEEESEDGRDE